MFRMLIHPSSGACDLFVELFHGLYCSGSMCVGVTLWYDWGGVVSVCRLKHLVPQDDARSNKRKTNSSLKNKYTNCKELKITPILDKSLEYKRSWIQHVNRMPRNRLPRAMKHYCPTGRRNHGRPLKRLLVTWDRNGSTGGPTAWQIYDDIDDDDDGDRQVTKWGDSLIVLQVIRK